MLTELLRLKELYDSYPDDPDMALRYFSALARINPNSVLIEQILNLDRLEDLFDLPGYQLRVSAAGRKYFAYLEELFVCPPAIAGQVAIKEVERLLQERFDELPPLYGRPDGLRSLLDVYTVEIIFNRHGFIQALYSVDYGQGIETCEYQFDNTFREIHNSIHYDEYESFSKALGDNFEIFRRDD